MQRSHLERERARFLEERAESDAAMAQAALELEARRESLERYARELDVREKELERNRAAVLAQQTEQLRALNDREKRLKEMADAFVKQGAPSLWGEGEAEGDALQRALSQFERALSSPPPPEEEPMAAALQRVLEAEES